MKVNFKSQLDLINTLFSRGERVTDGGWNVWKVNNGQLYQNNSKSSELPDWTNSYYEYSWEPILETRQILCYVSNKSNEEGISNKRIRLVVTFDNSSGYKDTENKIWINAYPVDNKYML
jgi:hypothetical protein